METTSALFAQLRILTRTTALFSRTIYTAQNPQPHHVHYLQSSATFFHYLLIAQALFMMDLSKQTMSWKSEFSTESET